MIDTKFKQGQVVAVKDCQSGEDVYENQKYFRIQCILFTDVMGPLYGEFTHGPWYEDTELRGLLEAEVHGTYPDASNGVRQPQ
jgi:hypothetical protein